MHHTPFKLAEIVRTVCNKHIKRDGFAEEFNVMNVVMSLHYRNMIGIIPVTHTVHELIHSDKCDVCPNLVYGFWKAYIAEYYEFFDDISKEKCDAMKDWELSDSSITVPDVLKIKYSVIQCEGFPLWQHPALEEGNHQLKAIEFIEDIEKLAS
jgi:hypothetical protein